MPATRERSFWPWRSQSQARTPPVTIVSMPVAVWTRRNPLLIQARGDAGNDSTHGLDLDGLSGHVA